MPPSPEKSPSPAGSTFGAGLLLCVVAAIAYLPALRNGFAWDDDMLVTRNSVITAASGLRRIWFTTQAADYWPVTLTAFWVQWRLWGEHPLGYHAVNLALHLTEALLLWAVLRRMRISGAWLAALLFAVHPVNVETVAWISELKNLMAMLFYLLSVWFFLGARLSDVPQAASNRSAYALSLFCFVLALLSKGSVAILPLILVGIILWRRPLDRRDLARLAPFFAAAVVFAAIDVWFQRHGTHAVFRSVGALPRLLGAGWAVWFYLGHAFWPARLMFVYPEWPARTSDLLCWLPLLAAVGLTLALWRLRTPWSRPALFAWGYFCVALLPVLGFTDVYFMKYSLVADRYEHLALIGVMGLAAAAWARWDQARPVLPRFAAGASVLVFAGLTWIHCRDFRDGRTLFLATLRQNPRAWLADSYLGATPPAAGRPEGVAYLERALEINPDDAGAHYNLGVALEGLGRPSEAMAQYRETLRLDPGYVQAYNNLGGALRDTGHPGEAIEAFRRALRADPVFYLAENNLANMLLAMPGGLSEAIVHYEAAARIDPNSAPIQANLGYALAQAGRLPEAIEHDEQALRLDPRQPGVRVNLGQALMREGREAEAKEQFDEAARLRAMAP